MVTGLRDLPAINESSQHLSKGNEEDTENETDDPHAKAPELKTPMQLQYKIASQINSNTLTRHRPHEIS